MKRREEEYLLLIQRMREDPQIVGINFEKGGLDILLITNSQEVLAQKEKIVDYIIRDILNAKKIRKNIYKEFFKKSNRKLKVRLKTTYDRKTWKVLIKYGNFSRPKKRSPK